MQQFSGRVAFVTDAAEGAHVVVDELLAARLKEAGGDLACPQEKGEARQ
jgi:hypothetical protein